MNCALTINFLMNRPNCPVSSVVKTLLFVLEIWGSNAGSVKLDTVLPLLQRFFGACRSGALLLRWALPLVTRIAVIAQV